MLDNRIGLPTLLSLAILSFPLPATAKIITQSFQFVATGFDDRADPLPFDLLTMHGIATISYDPDVTAEIQPATLTDSNVPIAPPLEINFTHVKGEDTVTFGDVIGALQPGDFGLSFTLSGTGPTGFFYDDGKMIFRADTVTVTRLDSGAPELSTWALMLLGFAGLGFVGYRRRTAHSMRT